MKNYILKTSCIIIIIFLISGNCFADNLIKDWTKIYGSDTIDYGNGVSVDSNGNIYVAGYTSGEFDGQINTGGIDICLTKYNPSGAKQWTKIWGSTASDYGRCVSVNSSGDCYVSGDTYGAFDEQTNAGDRTICLTKYESPVPFVDITNSNFSVELPSTTAIIGGTNNEFIAVNSIMWWENTSTSGVSGTFFAERIVFCKKNVSATRVCLTVKIAESKSRDIRVACRIN